MFSEEFNGRSVDSASAHVLIDDFGDGAKILQGHPEYTRVSVGFALLTRLCQETCTSDHVWEFVFESNIDSFYPEYCAAGLAVDCENWEVFIPEAEDNALFNLCDDFAQEVESILDNADRLLSTVPVGPREHLLASVVMLAYDSCRSADKDRFGSMLPLLTDLCGSDTKHVAYPDLKVQKSKIRNLKSKNPTQFGLFASKPINKGVYICEFQGRWVPVMWQWKQRQVFLPNEKLIQKWLRYEPYPRCKAYFINHAKTTKANCELRARHQDETYKYGIFALSDIKKDEELTFDYMRTVSASENGENIATGCLISMNFVNDEEDSTADRVVLQVTADGGLGLKTQERAR